MELFIWLLVCSLLPVGLTEAHFITLQITTFNVARQLPGDCGDFTELLGLKDTSTWSPDIIAIGLQEGLVSWDVGFKAWKDEKNIKHLFSKDWRSNFEKLKNTNFQNELEWFGSLAWVKTLKGVAEANDYYMVEKVNMFGIAVAIFCKESLKHSINLMQSTFEPAGFGNVFPNKGGVAISLKIHGLPVTFIVSHLPYGDEGITDRMAAIKKINNAMIPLMHDYIFWFGDFNFRITDPYLLARNILNVLEDGLIYQLFNKDELKKLRSYGIFKDYKEPDVSFYPTYKYEIGHHKYNLKRRPAWTDRILYKAAKGVAITELKYDPIFTYTCSDHRPVEGHFTIFY